MADPFSTVASIITVAGLAVTSTKALVGLCRDMSSIPLEVNQALQALRSLHATLTDLQQATTKPSSNYIFSPLFCTRIHDCQTDLAKFETKLSRISSIFDEKCKSARSLKRMAKTTWEKAKWVGKVEQETAKFLDRIRLYQAEFSLELVKILM